MSENHDADLAVASLRMTAANRGGTIDGVIFHSGRARHSAGRHQPKNSTNCYSPFKPTVLQPPVEYGEYTAEAYEQACRRLGVLQSMGRVGSALDNAAAEACNSTIKEEYIHRHRSRTRAEARLRIATWIVDFYNTRRRHSACDGMSPIDYERFMAEARRPEAA